MPVACFQIKPLVCEAWFRSPLNSDHDRMPYHRPPHRPPNWRCYRGRGRGHCAGHRARRLHPTEGMHQHRVLALPKLDDPTTIEPSKLAIGKPPTSCPSSRPAGRDRASCCRPPSPRNAVVDVLGEAAGNRPRTASAYSLIAHAEENRSPWRRAGQYAQIDEVPPAKVQLIACGPTNWPSRPLQPAATASCARCLRPRPKIATGLVVCQRLPDCCHGDLQRSKRIGRSWRNITMRACLTTLRH